MKFRRLSRRQKRGIALIIVMIVIMVLGILAGGFAYSMKVETKLARNATMDSDLEWIGRSGVELAKWILAEESGGPLGPVDCLIKKWAGGPGDTNSAVAGVPLDHYEVGAGWLALKIVDNERKFNINAADPIILRQALTLIGVDAGDQSTIIDSILDWRDPDDSTHMSGTESDFYKSLQPPYWAKNGPIDDLSELLLVRGVTVPMFWGSGAGGHLQVLNRPLSARRSHFEEPTYAIGLVDLFSALSSRQVNINTASATVLQLIPEIDENIANAILSGPGGRAGPDGADGTEDDMPFRSPQEIGRIPGFSNPALLGQIARFFTVRSIVFEVQVDAHLGSYHRRYVATLRRNSPRDIHVLSFYWRTP
jgi:general secretion pathway protein K